METFAIHGRINRATECSCAEYVGNSFYIAAKKGNHAGNVNYRYDTVSNLWETLFPILSHSDFCSNEIGSLLFDYFLYTLSGSTCVPSMYSPAKNNWRRGASSAIWGAVCKKKK